MAWEILNWEFAGKAKVGADLALPYLDQHCSVILLPYINSAADLYWNQVRHNCYLYAIDHGYLAYGVSRCSRFYSRRPTSPKMGLLMRKQAPL